MHSRFHVWGILVFFVGAFPAGAAGEELLRLTTCAAGSAIQKVQGLDKVIDQKEKIKSSLDGERQKLRGQLPTCESRKNGYAASLRKLEGDASLYLGGALANLEAEAKVVAKGMKILGADACAQQAQKLVADLKQWDAGFGKNLKAMQCN